MRRVSHSYSSKEQRRDHRFVEPLLDVEIAGQIFPAEDWSLGGVRLRGLLPNGQLGGGVLVKFSGVRSGYLFAGEIAAEIVRIDLRKQETSLQFTRFHGSAFDALEGLITGRRGRDVATAFAGPSSAAPYDIAPTSP